MEKPRRKGGRPPGAIFTEEVHAYVTPEDDRLLTALSVKRGVATSAMVRILIREAAEREGMNGPADAVSSPKRTKRRLTKE